MSGFGILLRRPKERASVNLENDTEREANKRQLILTRVLSEREERAFEEEGRGAERR